MKLFNLLKYERKIHSLKTALAVLVGFLLAKLAHLPTDQWLIITIIVVMCAQINVGSVIQKSLMRLLGTLMGSLIGIATIFLFDANTYVNKAVIILAVIYFSYLATSQSKWNESGTLGAVTTVIILINPTPTVFLGLYRTIEILLGILIAACISQFVLPIHARTYLLRDQINTLKNLHQLYFENFVAKQKDPRFNTHEIMDEQIIKSLITQRKLALDAAREPFSIKSSVVKQFPQVLICEREILRSIDFMHHAFASIKDGDKIISNDTVRAAFHEPMLACFEKIETQMKTRKNPAEKFELPSLEPLRKAIAEHQPHFSAENKIYADAFLFCAEVLLSRLQALIDFISAR